MDTLQLYLSPIDTVKFKAIITKSLSGEGETESELPFFDGHVDHRTTLLKVLETISFQSSDFQCEEQNWMAQVGMLAARKDAFHPRMYINIGQALYQALFPEGSKVKGLLQQAIKLAESKGTLLHVQIIIEADAVKRSKLSNYPWELLHDGKGFLALRKVSFSRYIAYDAAPPNLPSVEQINVLLVSSTAFDPNNGLQQLSKQEHQAVRSGLDKAKQEGFIRLAEPKYATLNELRTYLIENQGNDSPHVIHFDGHGLFGKRCNQCRTTHLGSKANNCRQCGAQLPEPQGYLVFEDDTGKSDYVSAEELGNLLHQASLNGHVGQQHGVALIVLSACQSGLSLGNESVFNGVAQSLISHGVPAAIAMQFSVSVDGATAFSEQFYRSLGQREPLTMAVNKGREAMGSENNQWYRPVLYLRWQDNEGGQLFAAPKQDIDQVWLKNHMQKMKIDFVNHMRGGEELTDEQAASRYVELLVRKRVKPGEQEQFVPLSYFVEQPSARLLIFGEGGGGKTTSLRKLAVDIANQTMVNPIAPIPLYIQLNFFDAKERGFDKLLQIVCNSAGLDKDEIKTLWRKGRRPFLFLLDGFNEVGQDFQRECALAIQEFMQVGMHRYIVTSRPGGQVEQLAVQVEGINTLDIVQLDENKVQDFLVRHGVGGMYELMGDQLKGMARNPFMLWALAKSCARLPEGELPRNTGQLYQNLIDRYIFGEREKKKNPPPTEYNYVLVKKPILARVAITMTQEKVTRRKEDRDLLKTVSDWLKEIRTENVGLVEIRPHELMPDPPVAKGLLDETVYNGVLQRVGNTFEFMHQSVQDYFTAVGMSCWTVEKIVELTPPLVWRHVSGEKINTNYPFFEAIIMLSGLLSDSSDLLKSLVIRNPLLAAHCLVGATNVQPNIRNDLQDFWLKMLDRRHERYRVVACKCLGVAQLKETKVANRLIDVLMHDNENWVKWSAINALAEIGSDIAVHQLVDYVMREPNKENREWPTKALYSIKSATAVKLLFDAWRRTKNDEQYLFSWDDIPGSDGPRLREFLKQNFDIHWTEKVNFEKIDDGRTINIFSKYNKYDSLSLGCNNEKTKAILTIGNKRTHEFIVKTENGRLNIYKLGCSRAEFLLGYMQHDLVVDQLNNILYCALNENNHAIKEAAEEALRQLGSWQQCSTDSIPIDDIIREVISKSKSMPNQPIPALIEFLRDEGGAVRDAAVLELGERKAREGIAPMIEALWQETDRVVVHSIVISLKKCINEPKTLSLLEEGLRNNDSHRRARATIALGMLGAMDKVPKIIQYLQDDNNIVRAEAAMALREIGLTEVVPHLVRVLQEETDRDVLEETIMALGKIKSEVAVVSLVASILHVDKFKGRAFQQYTSSDGQLWEDFIHNALEKSDAKSKIIDLLQKALKDPDSMVRRAAIIELCRWEGTGSHAIDLLQKALQDPDIDMRKAAIRGLSMRKETGSQVVGLLREILRDPDTEVRKTAIEELGRRKEENTEDLLIEVALSDTEKTIRKDVAEKLRWFHGDTAIARLIQALEEKDCDRRAAAAEALGLMQDEAAVEPLLVALKDNTGSVRIAAALSLIKLKNMEGVEVNSLIQTLVEIASKDANVNIRQEAAKALKDIHGGIDTLYAPGIDALYAPIKYAFATDNYSDVIKLIGEELPFLPEDANLYWWRGHAYHGLKQFENALADYDQVTKFLPDLVVAHLSRATILSQLGRHEEALAAARQAAKLAPDIAFPLNVACLSRGFILYELGRFYKLGKHEEALAAARQERKLAPDMANFHLNLGQYKYLEITSSSSFLDKADTQLNLGWYAYKAGKYEEGIAASQRALELNPQLPMAAFNLGLALLASGEVNKAKDAYQKGVRICEGLEVKAASANIKGALDELADLMQSRSDIASAIGEFKQILETAQKCIEDRGTGGFDNSCD